MKYRTFLFKIICTNLQKYSLFFLSAIFSMTVFFIFINLWYTDGFQEKTSSQMHLLMMIGTVITVLFSLFIISYVHWYMMRDRMKSFSVLLSYGMTYKDIGKLLLSETLSIYVISLFSAFITGGIFSRLFFLISSKLLSIDTISYQLTLKSFLVTAVLFAAIFAGVLFISLFHIYRRDLTELSKTKSAIELKKNGNALTGWLAVLLLAGSLAALYIHNSSTARNTSVWILGAGLLNLICMYLVISHFSRIIYGSLRKNTGKYYSNILEASEFAMDYRQNRKTLYVMSLLTFGIVLFTSITYSLDKEAWHMTVSENPHDLYVQQNEALDIDQEEIVYQNVKETKIEITGSSTLPYIYMKAPHLSSVNNERSQKYIPVVSETAYNRCFQTDYRTGPGEAIQIIYESNNYNNLSFFKDNEILLQNASASCILRSKEVRHDKILNRYLFIQPGMLIVNDADYNKFYNEAALIEKGNLYLYHFKSWKESRTVCERISNEIYNKYYEIEKNDPDLFYQIVDRYGYAPLAVSSRIDYYDRTRQMGSYSLFIMGFISILFAFCIIITHYFKVFMGAAGDRERFSKLNGIGIMNREQEKLIRVRIRLLMFVPSIVGVIIGIGWCIALNFTKLIEIELSNRVIFINSVIVSGIFLGAILAEYVLIKAAYTKRVLG